MTKKKDKTFVELAKECRAKNIKVAGLKFPTGKKKA